MTKEKVINEVIAVVTDPITTTSLDGLKYMETKVQLEGDIYFFLHVYN